jgi:glycosyltransferase involved in cell wall biosynthesis
MPEISVVIPTYNRADLLPEAVESVLAQKGDGDTFSISEVIIVDDCSTDNTAEVVEKMRQKSDVIVYHKHSSNGGAGKARNTGAALANKKWIAFHDSDDLWIPDKMLEMISYMETHPEADLYTHWYDARLDGGRIMAVEPKEPEDCFRELSCRNFIGAPTIIVRKEAFLEVGGFDEEMRALEDWDFALRFAYEHSIRIVPKTLMVVDLVGEGVSSKAGNYYDARCRIIAKNRAILQARGTFNDAVQSLFDSAQKKGILKQVGVMLESYLTGV